MPNAGGYAGRRWHLALLLLVCAVFLIRTRYLGDPLIDVDEQFYLLAGDRMLRGALPYVDLWDRKPIGLFLIYAGIRLLGGDGILQYQLVASGFVAATAIMIAIIARPIAGPRAALLAGLAYVPALALSGGQGGQTPVFYNLPMAIAGWLIARRIAAPATIAAIRRDGALAMLLAGIALQIKYAAVFEAMFFGLALIRLSWRAATRRAGIVADAVMWATLALLPTLIALVHYGARGQAHAFLYANFLSVLARHAVDAASRRHDLLLLMLRLLPFGAMVAIGRLRGIDPTMQGARAIAAFIRYWIIVAFAGLFAFGDYFDHYALPLLVPLAIGAAPAFRGRFGPVIGIGFVFGLVAAMLLTAPRYIAKHGDAAYAARLAGEIRPRLGGRCLYVFQGDPILYQLTNSCLPSAWAFPAHLPNLREAAALGIDPAIEVRRIMAARPPIVVDTMRPDGDIDPAIAGIVRPILARDYRILLRGPLLGGGAIVWQLCAPVIRGGGSRHCS